MTIAITATTNETMATESVSTAIKTSIYQAWHERCESRRPPVWMRRGPWPLVADRDCYYPPRLRPDEYVISADEKSQLQALGRRHETVPCAPGRRSRYEFEYERGGTLAYLAAWDVHHANLFDRVEQTTGIEPFGRLVEQVMTTEPYASARTVYWIVDNGSSHAGKTSIKRMQDRWENARLIHLPVHASWLNQIELYFSILQRKALTPNDLATLDALAERLLAFGEHYRQIARPFQWTFTHQHLDKLLARIDAHEPQLALAA